MAGILTAQQTGRGMKLRLEDYPASVWRTVMGAGEESGDVAGFFKAVPWLFRGIDLLGNGVASVPFVILDKNDEEVETSQDYRNELGLWADPFKDLWLAEAALALAGCSYFVKEGKRYQWPRGLRYLVPSTITEKLDPKKGLIGFERNISGAQPEPFKVEEIVYLHVTDPYNEVGKPTNTRGMAALAAAGVLKNMDEVLAEYFKSGMIKTTVLSLPPETLEEDAKRLAGVWGRIMRGVRSALDMLVISGGAATPIVIGDGLAGLAESELTDEKREDIGTALGIPRSMLFSADANHAEAEQHETNFYKQTIIPDAKAIARAMNRQYFEPAGYRLQFLPEQMDIFQEDEEDRSGAFWNYAQALKGADPKVASVTMQIVGVELPGGMTWEEWEKILAEAQAKRQAQMEKLALSKQAGKGGEEDENVKPAQGSMPEGAPGAIASEVKALDDDLARWEKKALNLIGKGKRPACKFESAAIPADVSLLIEEMLAEAETAEQVRAIFEVEA